MVVFMHHGVVGQGRCILQKNSAKSWIPTKLYC